jgi:hypothetical protein
MCHGRCGTRFPSHVQLPHAPAEVIIADDRRVYSDEEFALILRKAAELAESSTTSTRSSGGLTLPDMKAAAAQAGIDPHLIERAARILTNNATAAPSLLERVFGGRARYRAEAQFPLVLDEAGVSQLMSAIRIAVAQPGEGHSSALGLTWHSSDDGGSVLSLKAEVDQEGTFLTAGLDRRGTLAIVTGAAGVSGVMAFLFGGTVANELLPGFEPVVALAGVAAVIAVARSYWKSSSRAAKDRLTHVMESLSRFLAQPGNAQLSAERLAARTSENEAHDGHPSTPDPQL